MGNDDVFNSNKVGFGLDFGTYRSSLAYMQANGQPKVATYRGECVGGVPSLFWRTAEGEERIGDEVSAFNGPVEDPNGICTSIKMLLSEKYITLNGHLYKPSEIAVKLAKRVLQVSKEALSQEYTEMEFDELVVGVPARFNAAEKGEICKIMEQATGHRKIRLVPEPILAALANDFYNSRIGRHNRPVLVYDMGAGTFDVVLLKPNDHITAENPYPYIVHCPDGLRIAGDELDTIMETLLMQKIRESPQMLKISVLENTSHHDRRRLRSIAREMKEHLSNADTYTAIVSGVECGVGVVTVKREEYEALIAPRIQETIELASAVLKKSGHYGDSNVDILMVGGSTYIPLVRKLLERKFPWIDPDNIFQRFPESAVALGAAIYACTPNIAPSRVPFGYAVKTFVPQEKREMLDVRIPSGANLPMTVKATYCTRFENQDTVMVSIYEVSHGEEGENIELSQGRQMGDEYRFAHSFGKKVPKGTVIELTTTLTEDGLLTMRIDDMGVSDRQTEKTFSLTNLQADR